ncbi:hypothetical protein DFH07DRAFT_781323 [Mycena maculata]|uniref:F-box domain-containing protein n=1 Tax=Mycena maculata TaxID=230809 RepID=A0AAD7HZ13_9AGAR|nr:hypothetical protein DFH07DRAFT_781323 [Mycena maculata]
MVSLPPEIWLEVIGHLPDKCLLAVRLTSPLLRQVANPRVFSHFHMNASAPGKHRPKRLAFWSEEIAHHVRSAEIIFSSSNSATFIDKVFSTVTRFAKLRSLAYEFDDRPVELFHLRAHTFANLRELRIRGGILLSPAEPTSQKIAVESFSWTKGSMWSTLTHRHAFLSMLEPSVLRSLEILDVRKSSVEHLLDVNPVADFNAVHTLSLQFHTTFPRIHGYLARFPAVRDLRVHRFPYEQGNTPVSSTPLCRHLQRYEGSSALLPTVFAGAGAALAHLAPTFPTPAELLRTLREVPPPLSVTSLAISVLLHHVVEGATFVAVLALFPCLHYFKLTIKPKRWYDDYEDDEDGYWHTRAVEPGIVAARLVDMVEGLATLEHVSIEWEAPAQGVPDLDALRLRLLQAAPGLQAVDLTAR